LGKIVHLGKVREFIGQTPAFRARDVELIVGDRGYALLMLHNLVKKGEIHRVTRGWYSRLDDPVVSVFAFKPAYLGLEEALSLHGLWDQETNVVLVTPRVVRTGVRKVMGSTVLVRKIERSRFFGYEYVKYDGLVVPVSDVEKTLIDLVYYGVPPDEGVMAEIKKRVDLRKLNGYLEAFPRGFGRRARALVRESKDGRRRSRGP
jgi:predicted transcriptional regulator of viral defense system